MDNSEQQLRKRKFFSQAPTFSGSWNVNSEPALPSCCPLRTPIPRRAQTAALAWHISALGILLTCYLYSLANPLLWIISIPYTIFFLFDKTPGNGNVMSRASPWFKSLPIWKRYCEYFPITLVKTAELRPTFTLSKDHPKPSVHHKWFWQRSEPVYERTGPRYIFGYHPHGVGCLGAFGVFSTEGCQWSKLFPGIPVSLLTLVTQFHFPFYRDYLMALGISAVSRKNCLKMLEKDYSVCIVVGGARESLLKGVGSVELVLNRRKGFIKLALEAGNVCVVPTFAFGETDCYNIIEPKQDSLSRKVQHWMKNNWGFTIPLFYARGLFNYDFGFLPFRKPITVVVGRPIYIEKKSEEPKSEELDYYHDLYIKELNKLFYENRDKFGFSNVELKIIS
ncbi:DGA1 (YOR245C) [Zygosaccharomyces parabailii]|uniref:Diacylglycerol O-acyltransferase n=1 Tax=Zygosaccharomyces bailii (strain CLIB 213 / ATCC 58445 / CBS 680 / BCRC 21525 / NBRC 1098 / NCYC 1416 / NRRL Y-2227) TaxID=1333698 RepID=A0A8J2TA08_ZYGB2|nr:DGA1 (YOR245C) [Zygosaccharomyces parabailii]CDF91052.1 ZYBA0S09-03730g1_1 [Zygosaccharomyces bailii CLIB 213]CDH14076.1 related to Diacylglycerol O-acyltransferase 1 [Zygosaccharomyces bailii ISA1307]SJM86211.1 related to Diacylglycerol O-acyltransferase 1 [Zygosaccharomyces bailii]